MLAGCVRLCMPAAFGAPPHAPVRFRSNFARWQQVLSTEVASIKEAGTYKKERVIISQQDSSIRVNETPQPVLNFCANNYLGLCNNERLMAAADKALKSHGLGLGSVRNICGTQDIHVELERAISAWHRKEDTILYGSCFDANAGLFEAILGKDDAVLSDSLNHASIIDGIRLCKANKFRYAHNDMADLEAKLKEAQSSRLRLIMTDAVFSMDGDIAPLKEICDLAEKYDAIVCVDECHGTGILGVNGLGAHEYAGVVDRVDIINSTLGKAIGGATGGFTTARKEIVELVRQRSRPYLFSNSVAPAVVGAGIEVVKMVVEPEVAALRSKLRENFTLFRSEMTRAGFSLVGKDHAIVPVMVYDAKLAGAIAADMLKEGIYVIGFSFPTVPKDLARIRVQLSAAHSRDQVERCVAAFVKVGRRHGVVN